MAVIVFDKDRITKRIEPSHSRKLEYAMHKININVVSNGYISTVPITFYYNDYRLNSSEVGEAIRVSGIVHTSKHEVNGKMRYYQNYVANGVL